ncbi:MAG: DUF1549 domain-containing protein [Planctomycetia bacterium]|nr:DUF1549 domain-containing protein [Planctomycetia bacterium]
MLIATTIALVVAFNTDRPDVARPDGKAATSGDSNAQSGTVAANTGNQQTTPPKNGANAETPDRGTSPGSNVASSQNTQPSQSPQNTSPQTPASVAASHVRPKLASASSSDAEVVAAIDEQIRKGWLAAGIKPSDMADDGQWCRRVFLDIIGRIPTSEEVYEFLGDRSPTKRQDLVDRLLTSDDYAEDFARNWTSIWMNLLVGRSDDAGTVNREGLRQYLRRSLLKNKPYDRLVSELISATGTNRPGDPDHNGAVNFLLAHTQEKATPATSRIAQTFLGVQVQCTQCHNHPFNTATQNQFWELNSFLRQMQAQEVREGDKVVARRLVDVDFRGEGGQTPDEAEVYYEQRNGLLKVAYPVFIDGRQIPPSGLVNQVNRRQELAKLVVDSPNLNLALVNRMWAHFLGAGFTRPIDDLGPHNAPSHPELLERLAAEFRGHGYDVRQVIRWITLSKPYGLSSRPGLTNQNDDPMLGEAPLFSRFYVRQMRAEELYESVLLATHAETDRYDETAYHQREVAKSDWMQQFTFNLQNDEKMELTAFNGSITQTLDMWNGTLVAKATAGDKGTFLHEVAQSDSKGVQKVQRLFTAALGRLPTMTELKMADEIWRRRKGNTTAALQDIWWALLNSSEFILNH